MADPHHDVGARTLELVNIASPSREEREIAEYVVREMPWEPTWRRDETLWYDAGPSRPPAVVFAGHLDTVPPNDNLPGRLDEGVVHGLGASDMKGGLAVMTELAWAVAEERSPAALDCGFLFFPREEIALEESPLPELFATGLLDGVELVVVLEPTDNAIQVGCVGTINGRLRFEGVSAHTARPWLGVNAIGVAMERLAPVLGLEPRDVYVDELLFREVLTVTSIVGGRADNVVPDEVVCSLNFRYAPTRTQEDAEKRLLELAPGAEIVSHSPAAHVPRRNRLVQRLREIGPFPIEPKQAWTPVAQFAAEGLDAINLGPGATRYAHTKDEQVDVAALERCFYALRAFVAG